MLYNILQFNGQWRSYQKRVLDHFDSHINDKKIHIVAAPGSGKTTLGIELIKRLNKTALILAPSITIREQWVQRICDAFLLQPERKDQYISQDLRQPKLITVVTYQALHSAMTQKQEELSDDDTSIKEIVDFQNFDCISCFKECHLHTLCLDECHHLRNEWWKSLELFKKAFPDLYTISLTATPPYDETLQMWLRYTNMCGDIDEEITIPELVKENTLCPHQDYVYFNYPTKKEHAEIKKFNEHCFMFMKELLNDEQFTNIIKHHRFFKEEVSYEELLEHPSYLSSLLIFLNEKKIDVPKKFQTLLGATKLEKLSLKWLEIILQNFLYDDPNSFYVDDDYRKNLLIKMKANGLIERKKVCLQMNDAIQKLYTRSVGKCESIKEIVKHEYSQLHDHLRLLILTDYIRKEYESSLGDDSKDFYQLGVLPFFELIRQDNKKINPNLKLGVLCGTIIIIPKEAKSALLELVEDTAKLSFTPAGKLDDYVKVEINGNQHFITEAITKLFEQGAFQVLIGTKSLLGEGWDSPCINSLILASFVGSYMLSNQMRGRAIRTYQKDPNKTSNIWHLVCVNPNDLDSDENMSEDYLTLKKRMEHFLGLHYELDTIESGIERLSILNVPFTSSNIKKINKQMLSMSSKRNLLKERWNKALTIYEEIEIADEIEIKEKNIPGILFFDALRLCMIIGTVGVLGCIVMLILFASFPISSILHILVFLPYATLFIISLCIQFKKLYTYRNPLHQLQAFGNGILKALQQIGLIDSMQCRVVVESNPPFQLIYLLGGSGHDKAIFSTCIDELFTPIDNQRYILYRNKHRKNIQNYFPIPDCFSKRKEDAILFASIMKPYIGKYEVIYTRNEQGRKILLQGRMYAFTNKQERCISKKKVKSALE